MFRFLYEVRISLLLCKVDRIFFRVKLNMGTPVIFLKIKSTGKGGTEGWEKGNTLEGFLGRFKVGETQCW